MPPRRNLIEAGAGCGKTYSLVSRYIEGLGYDPESGKGLGQGLRAHPREILAVTFTEEAARQMKERVGERLKKLGLESLAQSVREESQISTFHSLCYKLLRPHLSQRGYEKQQLLPPPYAKLVRERHILSALARATEASRPLLEHFELAALSRLGRELWFSESLESGGAAAEAELRELSERVEAFLSQDLPRHLKEAAALFPEELSKIESKGWLLPLFQSQTLPRAEALKEWARLNFRGDRGVAKALPELQELAQQLREFARQGLEPRLSPQSLADETQAQKLFLDFVRGATRAGPKVLDFSALEFELAQILRQTKDPLLPPPRLLLVDEFQDTNPAQYEILERLSGAETEWYFVGDPKQSIYAFRGADVSLFLKLRSRLELQALDTNYRSEDALLLWVNSLQELIFANGRGGQSELDPPPQSLRPALKAPPRAGAVRFHAAPKDTDFFPFLLRDLARRRKEIPDGRQALLFLSWRELHRYAAALKANGVPFRISGGDNYLEHLLTGVFCGLLDWLENRDNSRALLPWLRWERPEAWRPGGPPTPDELRRLETTLLGEEDPPSSWSRLFYRVVTLLQPERFPKGREWAVALEKILTQMEADGLDLDLSWSELAALLRQAALNNSLEVEVPSLTDESTAPLQLLTIHGSKGLEFESVFLPELYERARRAQDQALEEENSTTVQLSLRDRQSGRRYRSLLFEKRLRQRRRLEESEMRRLFYVALTRAKATIDLYFHEPAAEKRSTPDPFALLGWPRLEHSFWNLTLEEWLEKAGAPFVLDGTVQVERIEKTEEPPLGASSGERWLWPAELSPPLKQDPFYEEGVSRYLARKNPGAGRVPVSATLIHSQRRGEELHHLLEIWDGSPENLEKLLPPGPDRELLRAAAQSVRGLPELTDFWVDLKTRPQSILREFGLLIEGPDHRLSGYADALWFRESGLVILDWKTGSSLLSLEAEPRLEKIRSQLRLYAEPFLAENVQGVRALAVGLQLRTGRPPEARVLVDEIFHQATPKEPPHESAGKLPQLNLFDA